MLKHTCLATLLMDHEHTFLKRNLTLYTIAVLQPFYLLIVLAKTKKSNKKLLTSYGEKWSFVYFAVKPIYLD